MTDDREYPNGMGEKAMHDTVIKIAEVSYQTGLSKVVYRGIIQSSRAQRRKYFRSKRSALTGKSGRSISRHQFRCKTNGRAPPERQQRIMNQGAPIGSMVRTKADRS